MNKPREYTGISQVGGGCYRQLQYYHYWAYDTPISARIQRLFNFGHMMENHMIADLAKVGIYVVPDKEVLVGETGHWKGHTDGVGSLEVGPSFLMEFKTHNDKSFKDLVAKHVKISKPGHYDQVVGYMGYKKLDKTLYVAYNKNNSEYYTEWIPFDPDRFRELRRKQVEIIAADTLLPRIGNNSPTWFECRMCDARHVCFGKNDPEVNCRTCKHVDVLDKGQWVCSIGKGKKMAPILLSTEEQRVGCEEYKKGKMFRV